MGYFSVILKPMLINFNACLLNWDYSKLSGYRILYKLHHFCSRQNDLAYRKKKPQQSQTKNGRKRMVAWRWNQPKSSLTSSPNIKKIGWLVGWLVGWSVGFYGVSTLVGYLMPNPVDLYTHSFS